MCILICSYSFFLLPLPLQHPSPQELRTPYGYIYHLFIYRLKILVPIFVVPQTLTLILPLMHKEVLFKGISWLYWFFSYSPFKICHTTNHLDHFHHQMSHSCQLSVLSHFHRRKMSIDFAKKCDSRKIRITLYTEGAGGGRDSKTQLMNIYAL